MQREKKKGSTDGIYSERITGGIKVEGRRRRGMDHKKGKQCWSKNC